MTYLISLVFCCTLSKYEFRCWRYQTHRTTENKLDLECILRTRWALFCISSQSPPRKFCILTPMSNFTVVCDESSTVTPGFFFVLEKNKFAKNSLIKNIFEDEKNFDSRTYLFFFFFGKRFRTWCIWAKARTSS